MPLFYRFNDLPRVRVQLAQARFNVSHMRNIRISRHFTRQIPHYGPNSKSSPHPRRDGSLVTSFPDASQGRYYEKLKKESVWSGRRAAFESPVDQTPLSAQRPLRLANRNSKDRIHPRCKPSREMNALRHSSLCEIVKVADMKYEIVRKATPTRYYTRKAPPPRYKEPRP